MTGMGHRTAQAFLAIAMTAMAGVAAANEGSGKGTIGIVCIAADGAHHFWSDKNPEKFATCIDDVVNDWATRNSSSSTSSSSGSGSSDANAPVDSTDEESADELIHGFDAYRRSMFKARAAMSPSSPQAGSAPAGESCPAESGEGELK